MTESISFAVVGVPITQGSKSAAVINGQARMFEQRSTKLKPWRKLVAERAAGRLEVPFSGPVTVFLGFRLPYPSSGPKRRRILPWKSRSFDVDKLARAVLDSLTGPIFVDDGQVLGLVVQKDYAPDGTEPGVWIEVTPFLEVDPESEIPFTHLWPAGWRSQALPYLMP